MQSLASPALSSGRCLGRRRSAPRPLMAPCRVLIVESEHTVATPTGPMRTSLFKPVGSRGGNGTPHGLTSARGLMERHIFLR